jgi:hypothetical protein
VTIDADPWEDTDRLRDAVPAVSSTGAAGLVASRDLIVVALDLAVSGRDGASVPNASSANLGYCLLMISCCCRTSPSLASIASASGAMCRLRIRGML